MRFKDSLWRRFFPAPSAEDQVEAFVGLLEKKLWVKTSEGIVTIGIRLTDAQLAFNLVEAALQNFLEARHAAELSAIADAISILESRSAQAHDALEKSQERLRTLRSARAVKLGRRGVRRGGELLLPALPDQHTSKLVVQVEIKRRAIGDLEEFRRRRIAELETRLQEQRAIYSESHPVVLDLQQSLDAMRQESTQVAALRRELLPLESELKQRGLLSDVPLRASRARDVAMQTAALEAEDPREDEDAEIDYAKSQARHALSRYNGMLDRIDMARLEEDTAQAAFKYRYVVIRPAQTPRGPVTPKPPLILGASLLAGLFLGVIGTSLVDLSSRKVVEAWQVEHALGLPLLGEVRDL